MEKWLNQFEPKPLPIGKRAKILGPALQALQRETEPPRVFLERVWSSTRWWSLAAVILLGLFICNMVLSYRYKNVHQDVLRLSSANRKTARHLNGDSLRGLRPIHMQKHRTGGGVFTKKYIQALLQS